MVSISGVLYINITYNMEIKAFFKRQFLTDIKTQLFSSSKINENDIRETFKYNSVIKTWINSKEDFFKYLVNFNIKKNLDPNYLYEYDLTEIRKKYERIVFEVNDFTMANNTLILKAWLLQNIAMGNKKNKMCISVLYYYNDLVEFIQDKYGELTKIKPYFKSALIRQDKNKENYVEDMLVYYNYFEDYYYLFETILHSNYNENKHGINSNYTYTNRDFVNQVNSIQNPLGNLTVDKIINYSLTLFKNSLFSFGLNITISSETVNDEKYFLDDLFQIYRARALQLQNIEITDIDNKNKNKNKEVGLLEILEKYLKIIQVPQNIVNDLDCIIEKITKCILNGVILTFHYNVTEQRVLFTFYPYYSVFLNGSEYIYTDSNVCDNSCCDIDDNDHHSILKRWKY